MKRIVAIFVLLAVFLTACGTKSQSAFNKATLLSETVNYIDEGELLNPEDLYVTAAENKNLALMVNTLSGAFKIKDLRNGTIWSSVPENSEEDELASGVYKMELLSNLIVYGLELEESKEFKRNTEAASVRSDGLSVYKIPNGFVAEYYFLSPEK